MGSDYPFPLGETNPGQLIESMQQLSCDVKVRSLYAAALNPNLSSKLTVTFVYQDFWVLTYKITVYLLPSSAAAETWVVTCVNNV